jgi:Tol biopolymer transport system component
MIGHHVSGNNPYGIIILDPFSGKTSQITPDYPQIDTWRMRGFFLISKYDPIYDDTMNYVMYLNTSNYMVMFDINKHKELWSKYDEFLNSDPVWSPDDKKIALAIHEKPHGDQTEIYMLNKSGEVESKTQFSSLYEHVDIRELSWSENGAYISFFIFTQDDANSYNFGVLNVKTGEVSVYCIRRAFSAVWMADNENIIVTSVDEKYSFASYLVDISTKTITNIGSNMWVFGWVMNN